MLQNKTRTQNTEINKTNTDGLRIVTDSRHYTWLLLQIRADALMDSRLIN